MTDIVVVVKPAANRYVAASIPDFATNIASARKPISWIRLLFPVCQRTQKNKR
jgi:hypothetical protein